MSEEEETIDFASLAELKINADYTKAPENFPRGKYAAVVKSTKVRNISWEDKKTGEPRSQNILSIFFVPTEDIAGPTEDELEERGIKFGNRGVKHDYWLDPDSLWRLNKLYEACNIDFENRSHADIIENSLIGSECAILITEEEARKDSDGTLYNRIKAVSKLD